VIQRVAVADGCQSLGMITQATNNDGTCMCSAATVFTVTHSGVACVTITDESQFD